MRMPLKEKWNILMRRDEPLAQKQSITPDDLVNVPLIVSKRESVRNVLENWYGQERERLRIAATCNLSNNNQSIMVESGIGMAALMGFSNCNDKLCQRPLEPELESGCVLVWKKNLTLSAVMSRFLAHVKESLLSI